MCGIAGFVTKDGRPEPDDVEERLARAARAMIHRGPDAGAFLCRGPARFAFRRLAIIDLSPDGNQPMANETQDLWVVYNGEIFNFRELRAELERNHQFHSRTDTEVLLHGYEEWGIDGLVQRIHGMYGFALWDERRQELYLARDRMGKKPLYYAETPEGLAFASTLNALCELLPAKPDIDHEALDQYLVYQAVPAPRTIYRGVSSLSPGHYARWSARESKGLEAHRYWHPSYANKVRRTEADLLDELDTRLRAAVESRLVSDVPLGAFLSGGVDSSLIVAIMSQLGAGPVEAIHVGFQERKFDERRYAQMVAEKCGARLHGHVMQPGEMQNLPEIIWQYGQPLADTSIVPTHAVARAAREHVTVVLNGDGGDEAFAGYSRPIVARAAETVRRCVPGPLQGAAAALVGLAGRRGEMLASELREPHVYNRGVRGLRQALYTPHFMEQLRGGPHPDALYRQVWEEADGPTDVDRALHVDMSTYLPDQLLTKMDVSTMAHSVEGRSPLLDRHVVEFAASIPADQLTRGYQTKPLLKRLAERYVPREVIYRRKRGLVMPASRWLRGEMAPYMVALLTSPAFTGRGLFEPSAVRNMVEQHVAGRKDWGEPLWTLMVLEIWFQMFVDGTLSRGDKLACLTEEQFRVPSSEFRVLPEPAVHKENSVETRPIHDSKLALSDLRLLMVGMDWFPNHVGGLNRYFYGQLHALAHLGVKGDALVSRVHPGQCAPFPLHAMSDGGGPLARLAGTRRAMRQLLREGPDLINAHFALYAFPWAAEAAAGRPLIVHFHGPWADEMAVESSSLASRVRVRLARRIERAVYQRAHRLITLSEAFRHIAIERYGVPADRVRVIPGGVVLATYLAAPDQAEGRQRLCWPADRRILLTIRRLMHRMGLENLIDAMDHIRRARPEVLLLIGGKGHIADALQTQIARLGLKDHVRLLGFVPDDQLPLAYAAADLHIVPTVALEGFGLVTVESLASGTPVLGTDIGGTPEILRGLATDLLFDSPQPEALAERILQALGGQIALPDAAGCRAYAKRFGWDEVAPRICNVFKEVISERSRRIDGPVGP